ncbi:sensor domain-containing diguanylate cyclase [Desulfogranum japonicum]|uniref:sensor domain-containing diguanylate cyclase n=1 Tax=Desulfogranum japonicum TaxID=231447 RepID=UPI000426170E|nr:sensor domain-containing diguanylate cyclase [Desulfogranum japonicum]
MDRSSVVAKPLKPDQTKAVDDPLPFSAEQLLQTLPVPALILEPNLHIRLINNQAAVLLHFSPGLSCYFPDYLHHDYRLSAENHIRQHADSESTQELDFVSKLANGTMLNLCLSQPHTKVILLVLQQENRPMECLTGCREYHLLQAQYHHNPAGILLVNEKMEMLSFNRQFLTMWSIPEQIVQNKNNEESLQLILEQVQKPDEFLETVQRLYREHNVVSTDEIYLQDGRVFYRHTYPVRSGGKYLGRVWYFLDISLLKQAEQEVMYQQKVQEAVLDNITDGIIACDAAGNLTLFNRAAQEMHRCTLKNIPLEQWAHHYRLLHPDAKRLLTAKELPLYRALEGQTVRNQEILLINEDGTSRSLRASGCPMQTNHGENLGAVISLHDITDLQDIRQELEHLAHHDCLTGLPNRHLFHNLLEQCFRRAKRENALVGILFLDLDNFKNVNDQFGHEMGDQVLRVVSLTLVHCLRDSDLICRWGGDEFVIALPAMKWEEDATSVADKICYTLQQRMQELQLSVEVSVSIGISIFPSDGTMADQLIRQADQAMFQAKQDGKNRYISYMKGPKP